MKRYIIVLSVILFAVWVGSPQAQGPDTPGIPQGTTAQRKDVMLLDGTNTMTGPVGLQTDNSRTCAGGEDGNLTWNTTLDQIEVCDNGTLRSMPWDWPAGADGSTVFAATVSKDCDPIPATGGPCFTTVQAAVDSLEASAPSSARIIRILPGTYVENITVDLATGRTHLMCETGQTEYALNGAVILSPVVDAVFDTATITWSGNGGMIRNCEIRVGVDNGDTGVRMAASTTFALNIVNSVISGTLAATAHGIEILNNTPGALVLYDTHLLMDCTAADSGYDSSAAIFFERQQGLLRQFAMHGGSAQCVQGSTGPAVIYAEKTPLTTYFRDTYLNCAGGSSCFKIADEDVTLDFDGSIRTGAGKLVDVAAANSPGGGPDPSVLRFHGFALSEPAVAESTFGKVIPEGNLSFWGTADPPTRTCFPGWNYYVKTGDTSANIASTYVCQGQDVVDSGQITVNTDTTTPPTGWVDLTRTTGSWITDGFLSGDQFYVFGFADPTDRTVFEIEEVTSATVLRIRDPDGVFVGDDLGDNDERLVTNQWQAQHSRPHRLAWVVSDMCPNSFADADRCFHTIQAAVDDAIAKAEQSRRFIYVMPGIYTENVLINSSTGFTYLICMGGENQLLGNSCMIYDATSPGASNTVHWQQGGGKMHGFGVIVGSDANDVGLKVSGGVASLSFTDNSFQGALTAGAHWLHLSQQPGFPVEFADSRILGNCEGEDSNTSAIYINTAGPYALNELRFTGGLYELKNNCDAGGVALIELEKSTNVGGGNGTEFWDIQMQCGSGSASGFNCIEMKENGSHVALSRIDVRFATGGARFVADTGTGCTLDVGGPPYSTCAPSNMELKGVFGLGEFDLPSTWPSTVTPRGAVEIFDAGDPTTPGHTWETCFPGWSYMQEDASGASASPLWVCTRNAGDTAWEWTNVP